MMATKRDKIAGGLLGLLVGDALGVPYEFHAPERLPPYDLIEMTPPPDFERAHSSVLPGTWSDDGANALCLLESLLIHDGFHPEDFGRRLVAWQDAGHIAVDGHVYDVGIATSQAISNLRRGVPALEAGGTGDYDNGNGSLMRVLPLALWHRGSDQELVTLAMQQSCVTHRHLRSQLCCALYCLWARRVLEGAQPSAGWSDAVGALRERFESDSPARNELDYRILPEATPTGSGYVVDCLRSARWAVARGDEGCDYETVVKSAILLGHDTDTTACVAGGIAGIIGGVGAIPPRWMEALRGKDLVSPLLKQLFLREES